MILTRDTIREVMSDLMKVLGEKTFTMHSYKQWPGNLEFIETDTRYHCRLQEESRRPSIAVSTKPGTEPGWLRVSTNGWPIFMPVSDEEDENPSIVVIEDRKVVFSYFGSSDRYFRYDLIFEDLPPEPEKQVVESVLVTIEDPTVQIPDHLAELARRYQR